MAGKDVTISEVKSMKSSLLLEIFIFYSWYYSFFFFFINLSLMTYKAMNLYYPPNQLSWDYFSCFLYAFVEGVRLFQFSKGNSKLDIESFFWALLFCVPILAYHGYNLDMQTYVTRIDTVMNSAAIFWVCSEFIIGALFTVYIYLDLNIY